MSSTFSILPVRFRAYLRHPKVRAAWVSFFWGVVLFYFLFCALVLATRWVLLPQVDKYKDDIARFLSDSLHAEVSIGRVSPRWDTFWPQLSLRDVVIQRPDPRSRDANILHLPQVEASFYWRSVFGQPLFRKLEVPNAEITVRRIDQGVYDIAGFVLNFNDTTRRDAENSSLFTDWLLRQGRIDVTSCKLRFQDLTAKPRARTTTLENINLTFEKNVSSYRAGIQGELAGRHENRIDIRTKFTAPLFGDRSWKTWSGELFFGADNLDVARLTRPIPVARNLLKSGRGSTRTWLKFQDGNPSELTSYLGLSDVLLTFSKDAEPLQVKTLSTRLSETLDQGELHAKAENLNFELSDGTTAQNLLLQTIVHMDSTPDAATHRSGFSVAQLDVETLKQLLPSVPFPKAAADLIRMHEASGTISNLEVSWLGSPGNTQDWRIKTDFSGLTVAHNSPEDAKLIFSGFENLSGSLEVANKHGHVSFATKKGAVSIPGVFETPRLSVDSLTGAVNWQLTRPAGSDKERLAIAFDNIAVSNEDLSVSVHGTWQQNETAAGRIDLTGQIERLQADRAWRYMPFAVPENVRRWLQGGLVSGKAQNGTFELRGDLVKYPWVGLHKDDGHFIVSAELKNAAIDYVPSMKVLDDGNFERAAHWPLLTDIQGRLIFEGASMTVLADAAKTHGATVSKTRADIPNLRAGDDTRLIINGKADAELQKFFDYVEASPVTGFVSGAFKGTAAKGPGHLDLYLDIPLKNATATKVKGSISMQKADIAMGWPKPPLKDVEGTVHFSEKGATASNVHARPFGSGDASVSVHTTTDGSIVISASGSTDVSHLTWFARNPYFDPVAKHMSGMLPFVSTVVVKKGHGVTVSARSSLQGVEIDLPAPLKKSPTETWDTAFSFTPVTLNRQSGYMIKVGSANRFDVLLQLPSEGSRLVPLGNIAVGHRAGLPDKGIAVTVEAKELSLVDWQPFVRTMTDTAAAQAPKTSVESNPLPMSAATQAGLSRVEVTADQLMLASGPIHKTHSLLEFDDANNISIDLASDEIRGKLRYEPAGRGNVTGSFERLQIAPKDVSTIRRFLQGESVDVVLTPRPTVLPSLDLVVDEFSYGDKKIGRMVLQAEASGTADEETLRITNFAIFSDVSALTGTGFWTQGKKLTQQHPGETQFSLKFSTKDLGQTLTDLGYPGVIENSTGTAEGHFKFDGIPWSPKLDTIAGNYAINFRKGTIAKVDTGAGGLLLSFVSMQSLFKRLMLDFSDFKSGFSFDTLTGSSIVTNGVFSTDNTKIVGTHGTILLSGNINVPEGSVDSRAIVLPEINAGNASLALTFVNPAVGIGSFLAQLLLRTPLSHLFKVEYTIKGPWANPVITKVSSGTEEKPQN